MLQVKGTNQVLLFYEKIDVQNLQANQSHKNEYFMNNKKVKKLASFAKQVSKLLFQDILVMQ